MELDIMDAQLRMRDFITVLVFLTGIIGTYYRLAGQIAGLKADNVSIMKKFENMEERNSIADRKTNRVEHEQHDVQLKVAVMATQIAAMSDTMVRIDNTMQDIAKSLREK